MNLALGAVFLAILLVPPLIFFYMFRSTRHAKAAPNYTLLEYLLLFSVIALFVHGFVIWFCDLPVDFKFIVRLITNTGTLDAKYLESVPLDKYIFDFAEYIFKLCVAMGALGWIAGKLATWRRLRISRPIRWCRSHRLLPGFRYFNSWWYFFRRFEYVTAYDYLESDDLPLIEVVTIVKIGDTFVFYKGFLQDFVPDGEKLERIYLIGSTRKIIYPHLSDDKNVTITEGKEEKIEPEGLLCLPYETIHNLHVRYVSGRVSMKSDADADVSDADIEKLLSDDDTEIIK